MKNKKGKGKEEKGELDTEREQKEKKRALKKGLNTCGTRLILLRATAGEASKTKTDRSTPSTFLNASSTSRENRTAYLSLTLASSGKASKTEPMGEKEERRERGKGWGRNKNKNMVNQKNSCSKWPYLYQCINDISLQEKK